MVSARLKPTIHHFMSLAKGHSRRRRSQLFKTLLI